MDTLYSSLRGDRFITIYVGRDPQPISIQEALLCNTAEYFKNLLTNGHFKESQTGVVSFPEDDVESWKLLVYWAMHRTLPEAVDVVSCCKAWYLGDKYMMPAFQDEAMYAILNEVLDTVMTDDGFVDLFAATLPETKPRQLLAEMLIDLVVHDGILKWSDLPEVQSQQNHMASIMAAMDDLKQAGHSRSRGDLRDAEGRDGKPLWMRYMVGNGPKEAVGWYWHHDRDEWRLASH